MRLVKHDLPFMNPCWLSPLDSTRVPCDLNQDDLLRNFPWYRGQADRPVVPPILLAALTYQDKKKNDTNENEFIDVQKCSLNSGWRINNYTRFPLSPVYIRFNSYAWYAGEFTFVYMSPSEGNTSNIFLSEIAFHLEFGFNGKVKTKFNFYLFI